MIFSISQGVAESEAHCINTDANHTSSKFSQFFYLADIFHFYANKRIFFLVFTSFLPLHKFNNEDNPNSPWYLHILHLIEPNQMLLDF